MKKNITVITAIASVSALVLITGFIIYHLMPPTVAAVEPLQSVHKTVNLDKSVESQPSSNLDYSIFSGPILNI